MLQIRVKPIVLYEIYTYVLVLDWSKIQTIILHDYRKTILKTFTHNFTQFETLSQWWCCGCIRCIYSKYTLTVSSCFCMVRDLCQLYSFFNKHNSLNEAISFHTSNIWIPYIETRASRTALYVFYSIKFKFVIYRVNMQFCIYTNTNIIRRFIVTSFYIL